MKLPYKIFYLLIILVLVIVACEDKISNKEDINQAGQITVNLTDLFTNNIQVDSLEIYDSASGLTNKKTYKDLSNIMILDYDYENKSQNQTLIYVNLYYENQVKTAYSLFRQLEDTSIGYLEAQYYHQNVILKFDTNPSYKVEVTDFYNYDALDYFFKEYKIEDADLIADQYLETPMQFLYRHRTFDNLDENMIPIAQYSIGDYYNPVFTCINAFAFYDKYLSSSDETYLNYFYSNADWIFDRLDQDYLLRYDFSWAHETVELPEGWTSAMAQGEGLALMCMAYHDSGDDKYLQAAHGLFTSMHFNKETSWNLFIDSEDYLWYEEYPSQDFCHVLNGKLFGIWGLWNYYCLTRNEDALSLFQGSIASIVDNYPLWDVDGVDGSHYCTHTHEISSYHSTHKRQLIAYRDMFNIPEFDVILNTFTNERN